MINNYITNTNVFLETIKNQFNQIFYYINNFGALNMGAFFRALALRPENTITSAGLLNFMQKVGGTNKTGGKNCITRWQYFMNAFSMELALLLANPKTFSFIGNDHYELVEYSHGSDDPDFYFKASNGVTYTIEAKMFKSTQSYKDKCSDTNFHKADYCLVFVFSTADWFISRKQDNYEVLYSLNQASENEPWLSEIKLPKNLFRLYVKSENGASIAQLTDEQLPERVAYDLIHYDLPEETLYGQEID